MDATFKAYAISQVKLFMFSGHDTTSSSIYYILHILSIYPSALQRVWEEHKSFFDFDLAEKAKTLEANPRFAQPASYTLAVIEETMHLFPVVSSTASVPGFSIVDSLGHSFHTENFLIWVSSQAVSRWWLNYTYSYPRVGGQKWEISCILNRKEMLHDPWNIAIHGSLNVLVDPVTRQVAEIHESGGGFYGCRNKDT